MKRIDRSTVRRTLGIVIAAACLSLTACGAGKQGQAASACEKAVAEKMQGKRYTLDRADMEANAKSTSDTVMEIHSTVVFDAGLASESKQTYDCRVQFDPGAKGPSVTFLQFNW